jgi:hypothetical protein
MLKFTNASGPYTGNPLYISKEWIVTVFEHPRDGGSLVTVIFGGPTGNSWEVEESLKEVINIINGDKR